MARYRDDAERKRIEYLIEKYKDRIVITRPQGTQFLVDGNPEILDEFLRELASRIGPENVKVYEESSLERMPEPEARLVTVSLNMRCEEAIGAISYLMARLRGVLYSSMDGVKVYVLRGRWGWARISIATMPTRGLCEARLRVEAFEPTLSKLLEVLVREFSILGEVSLE